MGFSADTLDPGVSEMVAEGEIGYAVQSPDKEKIAYTRQGEGLYLLDPKTLEEKRIAEGEDIGNVLWFSDSKRLFFFDDLDRGLGDGAGNLQGQAVFDLASGQAQRVITAGGSGRLGGRGPGPSGQ